MTRTRVRTKTGTETAATFVNNELMSGFLSIAASADASVSFLRDVREPLTSVFQTGLETQSLDQIRCLILDGKGDILEEWTFEVTYEGNRGLVELPIERVTDEVGDYGDIPGAVVVVLPVIDGIDVFNRADVIAAAVGSFGAGQIDIEIRREQERTGNIADEVNF